MILIKISIVVY